jgi:ABC-type hemin transport system ATPase subunit
VDLDDVSLQVRAGEVVGIAGVSGNGQQELLYALSGEDTRSPARSGMGEVVDLPIGRFTPASGASWACICARGAAGARVRCPRWVWRTTCC